MRIKYGNRVCLTTFLQIVRAIMKISCSATIPHFLLWNVNLKKSLWLSQRKEESQNPSCTNVLSASLPVFTADTIGVGGHSLTHMMLCTFLACDKLKTNAIVKSPSQTGNRKHDSAKVFSFQFQF